MKQPIPRVGRSDVERILSRDFLEQDQQHVRLLLSQLHGDKSSEIPFRVHLAILKIANGDIATLVKTLNRAKDDYRNILMEAEYPLCRSLMLEIDRMPQVKIDEVYTADWKQYQEWLKR